MVIIFDLVGQLDRVGIKGLDTLLLLSCRSELLLLVLFLVDGWRRCVDLLCGFVLRGCKRDWSYICFLFFGNTGLTRPFYTNEGHSDVT